MPWEWCTRIKLPTGPRRTYTVHANGKLILRARATSAVAIVRSCLPFLPKSAHVAVKRVA